MADGLNGINVEAMKSYAGAVKDNPELGQVAFRASSVWKGGCQSEVTVTQFYVNGQPAAPEGRRYTLRVDEPAPLGGGDSAPNPAEMMAVAVCGCLTAAIAANAALFDTAIDEMEVTAEIRWDMHGLLGLDRSVPCAASGIHYTVRLKGDDPEKLRRAKETIDRKSPILRSLAEPIPMTTDIIIG